MDLGTRAKIEPGLQAALPPLPPPPPLPSFTYHPHLAACGSEHRAKVGAATGEDDAVRPDQCAVDVEDCVDELLVVQHPEVVGGDV